MNISKFNKEELTIVESFLQSATTINNIYNKLYNLDISYNNKEYEKQITILKKELEKEMQKYQTANLTIEQKFKIIELLSNSPNTTNLDDINIIIKQNENDKINRRIINILIKEIINIQDNSLLIKITQLINELNPTYNTNISIKELIINSKIELAIKNDITLLFLSILNENINLFKYSIYKNELKKALYNTCYINNNIEKQLIENNLNVPEKIYLNSKLINDLYKINPKKYNIILNKIIKTQIQKQFSSLLEIKDKEYNNPQINISSIINQCFIRSLLTFLTDEEIYTINNYFQQLINNQEYLIKYSNNKISENNIINCLKNVSYDKTKKRIISLN